VWNHDGLSFRAEIVVFDLAEAGVVVTTLPEKVAYEFLVLGVYAQYRQAFIQKAMLEPGDLLKLLIALKNTLGRGLLQVSTTAVPLCIQ